MTESKSPSVREIPVSEFREQNLELVHGIFGDDLYDSPAFGVYDRNLFPHDGWGVLLLPERFAHLNNDRFIDPFLRDGLHSDWYRPINWLEVLMSVHWTREAPVLYQALAAFFTDNFWEETANSVILELPAITERIEDQSVPDLGIYHTQMLIDPLGEWGMIDDNEYSVSMLGAKGALFDRFVMALGGMEAIQKRFNYFLLLESRMDKREPLPADTYPDDIDEVRLGAFRVVYDRIGWPWPFPDHIGKQEAVNG